MMATPRFAYGYAELALVAEDVRRNRASGDPQLVDQGKLTAEAAALRLRVSTAIAVDWKHYAARTLPPIDATTDAEKVASLQAAIKGTAARRDQARQAIVSEWGERFFVRSRPQLWALVDAHDPTTARVRPYLHWESYTAALEAMLWWQTRSGTESIGFLTRINIEWRAEHPPHSEAA